VEQAKLNVNVQVVVVRVQLMGHVMHVVAEDIIHVRHVVDVVKWKMMITNIKKGIVLWNRKNGIIMS